MADRLVRFNAKIMSKHSPLLLILKSSSKRVLNFLKTFKVSGNNRRSEGHGSKPVPEKQHEIHILGDNCYIFSKATKGVRLLGKAEECRARKGDSWSNF